MILKTEPEILNLGGIVASLYGINPRTIKGNDWWDIERKKAYESQHYHCIACGIHQSEAKYYHWLEAHELFKYDYEKLIATLDRIVPLCHSCHCYIHIGFTGIKSGREKVKEILSHGFKILKASKLKCNPTNIQLAKIYKIPTLGLKPIAGLRDVSKKELEEFRKRYEREGGWKLSFEGVMYKGKSIEQIKKEYCGYP